MQFRKEDEENFGLELTPLIDVVFLLLIFFMVSTAFVDFPRQMDIALPTSKASNESAAPKHIEIEMTANKKIFVDGKPMTLSEIEKHVATIKNPAESKILIRADKNLPYGDVIQVMGTMQAAKITDISVAVK